ncbi:MAG: hypothetical protein A2987_01305 [Omnitrophica bacterium RIFCSPLOWO2_01_FULL_45_10]|nr:MAG: hypothetical protein A2987_01305 [Omnitrophica bacterium RIFCSPLOWO2_01_FULL_45_10]
MKNRLMVIALLVSILTLSVMVAGVSAFDHGKTKGYGWDIEDKFYCKAHLILENQEGLGLTDEQVEKVKELKLATKKDLIRKDAEIDVLAIDVKALLMKDTINTDAVNKLIDQKYELKKDKSKSLIGAYGALKNILTKEQKEKLKTIWKKCEKDKTQCPMGGGMKCPMMNIEKTR